MESLLEKLWQRYNSHWIAPLVVFLMVASALATLTALFSDLGFSDEVTSHRWRIILRIFVIAGACAAIWLIIANEKYRRQLDRIQRELESHSTIAELAKNTQQQLAGENAFLQNENTRLKNELWEIKNPETLPDDAVKILLYLEQYGEGVPQFIAETLNIRLSIVQFHLNNLLDKHYVDPFMSDYLVSTYKIAQKGAKYLIDKGLLK